MVLGRPRKELRQAVLAQIPAAAARDPDGLRHVSFHARVVLVSRLDGAGGRHYATVADLFDPPQRVLRLILSDGDQ